MWHFHSEQLDNNRIIKTTLQHNASPIPYAEVLQRWQDDAGFREFFITLLADCPFTAFRWETPPITRATAQQPFEFVLLNSPSLARRPDTRTYAAYFRDDAPGGIVEFANLGNDAILVVPCPQVDPSAYGHIAAFLRHAPEPQNHALWQQVGAALQRRLSDLPSHQPVWLSTAGGGVSWLHVRLDDRPKYYGYAPYRTASRGEES